MQNEATPDGEIADLASESRDIRVSLQAYRVRVAEEENRKFEDVTEYFKQNTTRRIKNIIDVIPVSAMQ